MMRCSLLILLCFAGVAKSSSFIFDLSDDRETKAWLLSQGAGSADDLSSQMLLAESSDVAQRAGVRETRLEENIARNASTYISRLRRLRQSGQLPLLSERNTTAAPSAAEFSDGQLLAHACHNKKLLQGMLGRQVTASEAKDMFLRCSGRVTYDFLALYVKTAPAAKEFLQGDVCRQLTIDVVQHAPIAFCASMSSECLKQFDPSSLHGIRPDCVAVIPVASFRGINNVSTFASDTLSKISLAQADATPKPDICFTLKSLMVRNNVALSCKPYVVQQTAPLFKAKSRMLFEDSNPTPPESDHWSGSISLFLLSIASGLFLVRLSMKH